MGIRISGNQTLQNNLARSKQQAADSMEKLSSGIRWTKNDPLPADRAISDSMSSKLREFTSYKRNANDAISFVQMGDSALNEMSNISIRMKELAAQASSPTLSDKERQFLFVEYQGLYDEVNRIANTTSFNGIPMLNGQDTAGPTSISFRIGSPTKVEGDTDLNVVTLNSLDQIVATSENLGLKSAENLLTIEEGVTIEDVTDFFESSADSISSSFDQAFQMIAGYRSNFGAISSRLTKAIDVIDVAFENLSAANSRLRDVDYATETSNLAKANILMQAGIATLAHSNLESRAALSLLDILSR